MTADDNSNTNSNNSNQNIKNILDSLHSLERTVFPHLKTISVVSELAKKTELKQVETMRAIQLLEQKGVLTLSAKAKEVVELDTNGEQYVKTGLPETRALKAIDAGASTMPEVEEKAGLSKQEVGVSIGQLKSSDFIEMSHGKLTITAVGKAALDNPSLAEKLLMKLPCSKSDLSETELSTLKNLQKRKNIVKLSAIKDWEFSLTEFGNEFASQTLSSEAPIESLTPEMIKDGSWQGKTFRRYDVSIDVPIASLGRRHPMVESNNVLRDVFVEMGFKEMEGPIVESEFWCFDALWIPQDHPARDDQDTFFLDGDADVPEEYVSKVKEMHEVGIKRSHTPKDGFSNDITKRRILRTHSTATTFRTLKELGELQKQGKDINGKYFYCAHNFRNEAIDATHLAEFFQAEGFIVGDDLSLGDLMGFVKEYYAKLGIDKIRFKPTFNPYTEPSMEAHYYDEKMGKWYALINSGVFREENLKPFGLENKRIIAWGMGATRVASLLSGAKNLRSLTGYTCDFEWLRTRPNMTRDIVQKVPTESAENKPRKKFEDVTGKVEDF